MFSLPTILTLGDTFFQTLTAEIHTDMLHDDFTIPLSSRRLAKSEQLMALNDVRISATRYHDRIFIVHTAILQQVQASLAIASVPVATTQTHTMHVNQASTRYESFNNKLSSSCFTDYGINSFSYKNTIHVHTYCSRAGKTMQQYGCWPKDCILQKYTQ